MSSDNNTIKALFCKSCLAIKVNEEGNTVEDYTDILFNLGERGAQFDLPLMYAEAMLDVLQKKGGCQMCTGATQIFVNNLRSMV